MVVIAGVLKSTHRLLDSDEIDAKQRGVIHGDGLKHTRAKPHYCKYYKYGEFQHYINQNKSALKINFFQHVQEFNCKTSKK